MIVLDTNVISELMRPEPDAKVVAWANTQDRQALFTTSITAAEVASGIERMPDGKRRRDLTRLMRLMFEEGLRDRILPFDTSCAFQYAKVSAHRRAIGRRIKDFDAMIIATCAKRGFKFATRSVADFTGCGVEVINPWTD